MPDTLRPNQGIKTPLALALLAFACGVIAAPGDHPKSDSLPALDAHGFNGVREITRAELVKLMTRFRPLSPDENANLDRGCPGLACVYQGLGLKRWPELARGTVAYLRPDFRLTSSNRRKHIFHLFHRRSTRTPAQPRSIARRADNHALVTPVSNRFAIDRQSFGI
jgi:hypothetical protein